MNQTTTNVIGGVAAASGATTATQNGTGFLDSISSHATEIGLAFTALTFLVFFIGSAYNWRLKHRKDKREALEHDARMAALADSNSPSSLEPS